MPGWGNLAAALLDNELENPKSVPNSKKFRNDSLIPIQKVLTFTNHLLRISKLDSRVPSDSLDNISPRQPGS